MTIELHTAGVLGLEDLLNDLRDEDTIVTSLSALAAWVDLGQYERIDSLLTQGGAQKPLVINIDPAWSKEDLKSHTLHDSPEFGRASELLTQLLHQQSELLAAGKPGQFIWTGFEAGLALVPLRPDHRESLCRQAKLQEIVAQRADTYYTYFSGPVPLKIK